MRPVISLLALGIILAVLPPASARGCKLIANTRSPVEMAVQAEAVVIGEIVAIESESITVDSNQGAGKVPHLVATLRIIENLNGPRGITHVRVAFVARNRTNLGDEQAFEFQNQGRPWNGPAMLSPGQHGCFFLDKHPFGEFYVPTTMGYPLASSDGAYDRHLAAVRNIVKAFNDPLNALQAKEAADRQLAACALVMKYRLQPAAVNNLAPVPKPISAEESKLIMKALGEMNWGDTPFDINGRFGLHNVFGQLQLTDKDGWQQPEVKDGDDYNTVMNAAAGNWLKSNSGKYSVRRFATPTPQ